MSIVANKNRIISDLALPTLRIVAPILLALVAGGLILILLGKDPFSYYWYVVKRGLLSWSGLQATLVRTAPLMFVAAGLIVAFRAGIWNLGVDGQFLLAAVIVAAVAPSLNQYIPNWTMFVGAFVIAGVVGGAWSVIPAYLKASHGINEIITTLMMTFLGISLANVLVKIPFNDPSTTVPQTVTLPVEERLPRLFDTIIHQGVLFGVVAVLGVHFLMTRTAFGLRLQVVGANPKAAVHAGLNVRILTYFAFGLSAALAGMGGAVEILGVWGTVRADWNPAYGLLVVPLVFLARFHGFGTIAFVLFFAVLMIGGESASRRLGVPTFFVLVLVGLLLMFLAIVEYLDHRWRQTRKT
ncbi:MAG: ABC transporter permease [Acidiferrobacteraceae bacterium]|nr:ABC transporter permease [Acidiferrobacteraceae bacterium]|tara:strand:- start:12402 stop:13463 length:1062 start_codon:yes stop_codon:yes gene_type:complete